MNTKLVKDLQIGDRVQVVEPDGIARITAKEKSKLFHASGGCFRLDMKVEDGPHKGKNINDQHHAGDEIIQLEGKRPVMQDAKEWLLVKRDLYFRPDGIGYTGIRDNAGRFTYEEAKSWERGGDCGVTMIKASEAPEFTGACFDDLARDHLTKQRDAARFDLRSTLRAVLHLYGPEGAEKVTTLALEARKQEAAQSAE